MKEHSLIINITLTLHYNIQDHQGDSTPITAVVQVTLQLLTPNCYTVRTDNLLWSSRPRYDTRRDRSRDGAFKGASTNFENYRLYSRRRLLGK